MAQHYSDPKRASDPHALPDLEVWKHHHTKLAGCQFEVAILDEDGECRGAGWYWQACFPGCLPDGEPNGPFETEDEALADAREGMEYDDDSN